MDTHTGTVRKTYKYKLQPTPAQAQAQAQAQALESALCRCRTLYNCALEQRKTWWGRGQGRSATYYQQQAELPDLKAACPEYAGINAQVLQDVLLRVERAYQAFFRRVQAGESPGYPRFQGWGRYHSFTYPQVGTGTGTYLDNGFLVLSKIGRLAVRWSRPLEGTPKTVTVSKEADGWYACFSCADVPIQPLPPTGRETGIDMGLQVFLSDGRGGGGGEPAPLPPGRKAPGQGATPRLAPAEGQQSPQEGIGTAGESPSARQAPARRSPLQDRAGAAQGLRHDLS
jgi:putative transposase